jgi:hypothetical protein
MRAAAHLERPRATDREHRRADIDPNHSTADPSQHRRWTSHGTWPGGHVEYDVARPHGDNLQEHARPGRENPRQMDVAVGPGGSLTGEVRATRLGCSVCDMRGSQGSGWMLAQCS